MVFLLKDRPREPKLSISPFTVEQQDDFAVIYKPEGIPVHREQDQPGILEYFQDLGSLFLCHRLDRDTSGLLLLARNKDCAGEIGGEFERHRVKKTYLAIGVGKPSKKQGWIKGDMKKARNGNWKLTRTLENPAITQFESTLLEPSVRGFLLKPKTGKTHQLRVALKSLGSPILGDPRYGAIESDRMYLHAAGLEFALRKRTYQFWNWPVTGEKFEKLNRLKPDWEDL